MKRSRWGVEPVLNLLGTDLEPVKHCGWASMGWAGGKFCFGENFMEILSYLEWYWENLLTLSGKTKFKKMTWKCYITKFDLKSQVKFY